MQESSKWLTKEEAAEYLKVQENTLKCWRQRKHGPAYSKCGGIFRYKVEDLDAWLEAGRVEPGKAKAVASEAPANG